MGKEKHAPSTKNSNTKNSKTKNSNTKNSKTVLLVDDNLEVLIMLERFLSGLGYRIKVAQSAIDAVGKLTDDIGLIITDDEMPVMGGMDLRQITKMKYPLMPVIILTGIRKFDWDRYAVMLDVFEGVLVKPFRLGALLEIVRKYI